MHIASVELSGVPARPNHGSLIMNRLHYGSISALACCTAIACGTGPDDTGSTDRTNTSSDTLIGTGNGPFVNESGLSANLSTAGKIDKNNEFFQSLGTNGRAC